MRTASTSLLRLVITSVFMLTAHAVTAQTLTLAVQGDHFTVSGAPRFLLMVSYFDAMRRANAANPNVPDPVTPSQTCQAGHNCGDLDTDFAYFKLHGYDGVRIFPNWRSCGPDPYDGLMTASGDQATLPAETDATWLRFRHVLDRARANNLVVDLSFSSETINGFKVGQDGGLTLASYQTQVAEVARRLKSLYPNVFFDLQNEFENNGLTQENIVGIANATRKQDASRALTASSSFGTAGHVAVLASLNIAAPHDSRSDPNWYLDTTVGGLISTTKSYLGTQVTPVYLQEPPPFAMQACGGTQTNEAASHHRSAARSAKLHGAAGWTFHTRSTFSLSASTYVAKLGSNTTEQDELLAVPSAVRTPVDFNGDGRPDLVWQNDTIRQAESSGISEAPWAIPKWEIRTGTASHRSTSRVASRRHWGCQW